MGNNSNNTNKKFLLLTLDDKEFERLTGISYGKPGSNHLQKPRKQLSLHHWDIAF